MALFTRGHDVWDGAGAINGRTPDTVQPPDSALWSLVSGSMTIGSSALSNVASNTSIATLQLGDGGNEVKVSSTGMKPGNYTGNWFAFILRWVDSSNFWQVAGVTNAATDTISIYKTEGGSTTLMASTNAASAFSGAEVASYGQAFGTALEGSAGGYTVNYTSSTHEAGTIAGVRMVTTGSGSSVASCADWKAEITLAPEITVTHDAVGITDGETTPIDFGSVEMGGVSPEETFVITNDGVGTLTISSVTLPTGYAVAASNQVPLAGTTIAEGASKNLVVKLDADLAEGTKPGSITINSDDSNEAAFDFAITGEVTAAGEPDTASEHSSPLRPQPPSEQELANGWLATVTFDSGATKSSAFPIHDARKANLYCTAEFNTDTITFEGADAVDGTFYALLGSDGVALSITGVTSRIIELPNGALIPKYLKIVTNAATGAAATLSLHCKS